MKHLLSAQDLSRAAAIGLLDTALEFSAVAAAVGAKASDSARRDHSEPLF